jgi:hypothetical protein
VVVHSVVTVRIYRKDPPRITTFHNQLDLSLLKRIRHELITKINGKRKSCTYTCVSVFLLSFTLLQVNSEQPII